LQSKGSLAVQQIDECMKREVIIFQSKLVSVAVTLLSNLFKGHYLKHTKEIIYGPKVNLQWHLLAFMLR